MSDSLKVALNVLGTTLVPCSYDPLTGWFRDGCCRTDAQDAGSHVICARVTVGFLNYQMERGNDLITPRPEVRFAGLKPGDRWCVCALRWKEAYVAGCAPAVVLESTHARALDFVPLAWLQEKAYVAVGENRMLSWHFASIREADFGRVDERFKSHAWKACGG